MIIFDEKYACVTNQSPLESQFHTEISGYSTITLQRCKISWLNDILSAVWQLS